jgi:hypothetical protein
MDHFALLPAAERATVFARPRPARGWVLPRSLKKISGSAGRFSESSRAPRCQGLSSKVEPRCRRPTRSLSVFLRTLTSSSTAMPSDSSESRTLPTSQALTNATGNWMNWRARVRRLFRAPSATNFKTHFARSSGIRIGKSARIRPMPIARAFCSLIRSA